MTWGEGGDMLSIVGKYVQSDNEKDFCGIDFVGNSCEQNIFIMWRLCSALKYSQRSELCDIIEVISSASSFS